MKSNETRPLTETEQLFYKYLKKELFLSGIKIRTKISVAELCAQRSDVSFQFGNDEQLVKNIIVDFVLYKNSRMIAGIEVIDEPEEFENNRGEKMLKDLLFARMGCEYFRIVDLTRLDAAAKIVKNKTQKIITKMADRSRKDKHRK